MTATARTFRASTAANPQTFAQSEYDDWLKDARLDALLTWEDDTVQASDDSLYLSSFRYSFDSEPF